MAKMHVIKTIVINRSPEEVYAIISDFNHWSAWSPWLITEKGVKVNVRDDKKYYEWEGDLTGSGNMTITSEKPNEGVYIDLLFLKPWKSKAKIAFLFSPKNNGTEVSWVMDSSLPFFLFWMKKTMEKFIGMDFDRGLKLLKDYVEDGKVHCNLEFVGKTNFAGGKYVGIKTECGMKDLGENNKRDFEKLMSYMRENHSDLITGAPVTIYHKWDIKNEAVNYSAGVFVTQFPEKLPAGFITGEYPKTAVNSIKHTGPYHHLGNAWTSQMMRQRAKKFKHSKKLHPLEVYHNNPTNTPEFELKTEILMPIEN